MSHRNWTVIGSLAAALPFALCAATALRFTFAARHSQQQLVAQWQALSGRQHLIVQRAERQAVRMPGDFDAQIRYASAVCALRSTQQVCVYYGSRRAEDTDFDRERVPLIAALRRAGRLADTQAQRARMEQVNRHVAASRGPMRD